METFLTVLAGLLMAGVSPQPPAPPPDGASSVVAAQEAQRPPAAPGGLAVAPAFNSPEVAADRTVTFRAHAPQARAVSLASPDIPPIPLNAPLARSDDGVWQVTVGPLAPGAYRYRFDIDGVQTVDPRNTMTSESNTLVWSLVQVPGSELFDTRNVPHGAVAERVYWSTTLARFRRMHVYTPPGYDSGQDRYPVLYLLHGAGDSDDSWSTVGRAGMIIDNLIADRKARPMIVVMPAGHTSRDVGNPLGAIDELVTDFVSDVMPQIERSYRVLTDRANTAIAGLSMGGLQTLRISLEHLDRFAYIGVFSSGIFRPPSGPASGPPRPVITTDEWERRYAARLDDAQVKRGLNLLWFATGKEDFVLPTTQATVALFERHAFSPVYVESPGGHTWLSWRDYLARFAPQLFGDGGRR